MKFREIFRFELTYQLRHVSTWIYFGVLLLFPILLTRISQPTDETVYLNSPSFLIFLTVFGGVLWVLMAGAVAGDAAARDVQTRMHPLTYTAPVRKIDYLGGRFLAAFVLNALIQLAIPLGFFLVIYTPGLETRLTGPFLPAAYLTTYFYLALPVAFVTTACQFSVAVLDRRAIAGYLVSVLLFPVTSQFIGTTAANLTRNWELAKLIDLVGISIIAAMEVWTPVEKNTRLIALEDTFLWNRLLWLGIALGFITFAYVRFRFSHHTGKTRRRSIFRRRTAILSAASGGKTKTPDLAHAAVPERVIPSFPTAGQVFGLTTHVRQTRAVAWSSFRMMVQSKAGLTIVGLFALHLLVFGSEYLKFRGVPQFPTTMNVLTMLTASLKDIKSPLVLIPVLIVFYAGELIWREREAGLNRIFDTAPVSEWVLFLGRFFGLGLVIMVWLGFLMTAGILLQWVMGYANSEVGVYLKALFGFQLVNYLLFAMLALAVHVVVNHKYLGHLLILLIYLSLAFASKLGIEHNLLLYASDPGWSYTDMRGFGPYVGPWLWFKLYWAGWAALLAVAARLLWVRSITQDFRMRLQLTRHRFTRATAITAATAVAIILGSGGFIFYNTNVLNDYITAAGKTERQARYEQHYRQYKDTPQPILAGTKLHVELYPRQKKAEIRGTYRLVNKTNVAIDTIHLATEWGVETGAVTFDLASSSIHEDNDLGHRIYTLETPLQPGDSLRLSFEVRFHSRGFSHNEIDASVIGNGSYFINYEWLPAIGYQAMRELRDNGERQKYGLAPWTFPSLYDTASYRIRPGQELIHFEAVVGTEEGQIAVAPGVQVRKWTEGGRNYFQYATSAPIRNTYSFFSARYSVQEADWTDSPAGSERAVAIRIYYHPEHAENIDRVMKSVRASLSYYTTKFGPYPYNHLTIIERSGYAGELNAEPTTIDYGESFTLSNLRDNPWALDIVYFAMAHEVAHQWWGAAQLVPAHVEGGLVLSETLANYCALKVVEKTYGNGQVSKLLKMWRDSYEVPRSRAAEPLLQATDAFIGYRKGPLALYALMQYTGKDQVNEALRQLIRKHGSGQPPLPTSLDLYRELKVVTPDSLQYLLQDYFEKNTYWQLKTEQATAQPIDSVNWQVTLKVQAKKVVVDRSGSEIPVPMDDWVEVGIFAPWAKGEEAGKPLHLQKHRIRSGEQTITVTVPGKPARAGVDPHYLLIDLDLDNNTKGVKIKGMPEEPPSLI